MLGLAAAGCFAPKYLGDEPDYNPCSPALGIGFEGLEQRGEIGRRGLRRAAVLQGLCEGNGCTPDAPLLVGADHGFYVRLDAATAKDIQLEELSLHSVDPTVADVTPGRGMADKDRRESGGECDEFTRVWVESEMHPRAAGTAIIELRHGNTVLDEFPITVEHARSVTISAIGPERSYAIEAGELTVQRGADFFFHAKVYGETAELVVHSQNSVHWSSENPDVLSFVPFTESASDTVSELQGSLVVARPGLVGSTPVTIHVDGVTATLQTTVAY